MTGLYERLRILLWRLTARRVWLPRLPNEELRARVARLEAQALDTRLRAVERWLGEREK